MPVEPRSATPHEVSSDWIVRPGGRPAFVYAHQDDETVMAGIIQRAIGADGRGTFIWWTNGDGLAPAAGAEPEPYAEVRIAEAAESIKRLGASESRKVDLRSSEIENYRRLTHVARGGALARDALDYFRAEAERVEKAVREADPDRVFVLAWQGGNPEHDLTHVMVARVVRKLRAETGRPIPIIQSPAYEYTIACALRFKPWFSGDRRALSLSPGELETKRASLDAYPSQKELLDKFEFVVRVSGALSALRGRRLTVDEYLAKEEFGVVHPNFDYAESSHRLEALNYILDDFEGIPMRFSTMVRPVVQSLLADSKPEVKRGAQ